jgi:hypothetical protein
VYQDDARKNWGGLLAPGNYRSVTTHDVWQTCFLIGATPTDPIVVFDSNTGGAVPTATAEGGGSDASPSATADR